MEYNFKIYCFFFKYIYIYIIKDKKIDKYTSLWIDFTRPLSSSSDGFSNIKITKKIMLTTSIQLAR